MKRLTALTILACVVGVAVPIQAHTVDDPLVVDLIAGQTEPVGVVKIWNDADTLYVQLIPAPGNVFLKTHVHVAKTMAEIPQTQPNWKGQGGGNPIPGQFEESSGLVDDAVNGVTYSFGLGEEDKDAPPCTNLFVATHVAMGEEECITIVSGDGMTNVTQRRSGSAGSFSPVGAPAVEAWEPGPSYPNDGPDDSGWEAWSLWDGQLSINLVPTGADWIWESYRVLDPADGTALTFERQFDIGLPISGSLQIACDNGYEVFVNGWSLGSDNVYGAWRTSSLKQAFVDTAGWQAVGNFTDILANLQQGTNTLTVDAANEYFDTDDGHSAPGTASSNPGGLIFALDVCSYIDGETGWAGDQEFDGSNWATAILYTVQCPEPLVVNGGFEAPVVTDGAGWDIYDDGTAGLGWTVEWAAAYGGAPSPAHLELHRGVNGWSSYEGSQHTELDADWDGPGGSINGEEASVVIYQDICTCPGQTYTLRYAWSPRPNHADNVLAVYWDGDIVAPPHSGAGGSDTDWTEEIHTGLIADDYSTRLTFRTGGTADSFGMFLDGVSVTIEE